MSDGDKYNMSMMKFSQAVYTEHTLWLFVDALHEVRKVFAKEGRLEEIKKIDDFLNVQVPYERSEELYEYCKWKRDNYPNSNEKLKLSEE